jgi:acyl dehydratase
MSQTDQKRLEQGDVFTHRFSYTQEMVNQFAIVSGDNNPIHLDAEYAAKTMFKRPIMHGMLGASVFSKVLGTLFPGEGSIYLRQDLKFMKPMYVDTVYEAVFTVKTVNKEKHRADITTQIIDIQSKAVTIEGEATVMNTERI